MKHCKNMAVSLSVIGLWVLFYEANCLFGLMPALSGRGMFLLNGEYYRLFSGFLLHGNLPHLAANCAAMYWLGCCLERSIGSRSFLLFSTVSLIAAQIVFYRTFPQIDNVFGGSFLTFALIGLTAALLFFRPGFLRLQFGTWCANGILIYSIAGNIPIFSFMNAATAALHATAFFVGFVLAAAMIGIIGLWSSRS